MDSETEVPATELNGSEVAVVGMAGRFPGAADVEAFWENLKNGVESIRSLTDEELLASGISPAQLARPNYVKAWPVVDGIEMFDASLFNIPPHEARLIDPQHRLFLEHAYEALDRAGYNGDAYAGLIGVYAGLDLGTYMFNLLSDPAVMESAGSLQTEIGNDKDYLATRVSYKLNLRGPSITLQAACATSLVAVHLACQGLLSGECDVALAGGVSIKVPQLSGYTAQEGGLQSRDGHCRAFDARAQGTVFGSGLGVVVLRRLADALADGDVIHAVIKGSAVNNDGSVKIGYTAPGGEGQFQVIRAAQMLAEVDPATISYVEAHGTGTPLGDPIEVAALTRAFRASTDRTGFCGLGSVKTNIGHLKSAAGVTSLIKAVLALEHRTIPPSLHIERPNPHIDFANSPFYVVDKLTPWRSQDGQPLRAAVSSFGVGGTNAHAVLEEAPRRAPSGPSRRRQLLQLSAHTATALAAQRERLASHLARHPELPLADIADIADIAYTLRVGRRLGKHRGWLTCENLDDAVAGLRDPERFQSTVQEGRDRPVAFLFPGQGAQYPGMGRELYQEEPVFRAEVDRACEALRQPLGLDLRTVLYPAAGRPEDTEEAARRLEQTALAQPALFVIEHALARLWMSWGIQPQALLGHSIGEYVAATLAGVFRLEDALALVAERGRLMQGLPAGAMLSVPMAEADLLPRLPAEVSLAAVNGPARLVVSGPEDAVAALEAELTAEGVACRRLHTSHAFHSGMMDPILAPFAQRVSEVPRQAPRIPFVSNLTGTWITPEQATDPEYWARHLRQAVRFADGLRTLAEGQEDESLAVLLEVGPGQNLSSFARQLPGRPAGQVVARSLPHPKETRPDGDFLLGTLGQLWAAGVPVDWTAFQGGERRNRVELPPYPFERQRYWVERRRAAPGAGKEREEVDRASTRQELPDWFYAPAWQPAGPPDETADTPTGWLLLGEDGPLQEAISRRLEALGQRAVRVTRGERLERTAPDHFTIDPLDLGSWVELLGRLQQAGPLPDRVLHLWGVTEAEGSADLADLAFYSLLGLGQALGRQSWGGPVRLRVVTDGLQSVRGEPVLWPEKATALGPVRTLPLEHREIDAAAVDVVVPAEVDELDLLAEALVAEASSPSPAPVIAWRGEDRWVESLAPVRLGAPSRLPLREQGVYLITGGLGGLGLTLAEDLARSHRARLVLVGRSGLPERDRWPDWEAVHGEDDATSGRIRQVRRLEELGAEVLAVAADVTDEASLREAVRLARERFGPVQGAIHSAGVAGGGVIQLKTREAADGVLAPKVRGTRALAAALADEPLDFLVLCSSTIALTGGIGQVDYCAANSFLDAFARSWKGQGRGRALSINWGPWKEVGMAAVAAVTAMSAAGAAGKRTGTARTAGTAERPAVPAPAPVHGNGAHPLIERRSDEGPGTAFSTDLSPARHWILAEHRILGTPAVPGTAYLEMARAAFAEATGAQGAEIREVSFVSPLLIPEGDSREVRVALEGGNGAGTAFRVASRLPGGSEWQEHAHGHVAELAGPAPAAADLAALAAACSHQQLTAGEGPKAGPDGFSQAGGLVAWGPRWQSFQHAHLGDDQALLRLQLPAVFAPDLDTFGLHPALLDVATAFGAGIAQEGNLLPYAYRSVRYFAPLPGELYAHIRRSAMPAAASEEEGTLTLDITLMDATGAVRTEVEGFILKRVAQDSHRPRPRATGVIAAGPSFSSWIAPAEGAEAFRRALSRGRFAQVAVSPVDLPAALARLRRGAAPEEATARVGQAVDSGQAAGAAPAKAAQPEAGRFPRPELDTAYAAPRTDTERILVDIWQKVLGIEPVGVHDNFFDLGGDSVVGIQVVAKAGAQGLQLSPEQLFEHQTIAALARVLTPDAPSDEVAVPAEPAAATAAAEEFTPDAFPEAGLSAESLERLFARVKDITP